MRLRGLHHVTAICRDVDATIAFYRDVLGLPVVHDGPNEDDPEARHVRFALTDGTLVTFLHYPRMRAGVVGIGSTPPFALRVDSAEEPEARRDSLRERGVACAGVHDRGAVPPVYLRDPAGHIVEIAPSVPGAGGPAA